MSVNIVTGPNNAITKIAGLGSFAGNGSDTYVTIDRHNGDINNLTYDINNIMSLIEGGALNNYIIEGYYNDQDGEFYEDSSYTILIEGDPTKIYLDLGSSDYSYYRFKNNLYYLEDYYRTTGGTISGWCEVDSNYNLYVGNTIYLVSKAESTSLTSPCKIYFDRTGTTEPGEDGYEDVQGLALSYSNNKVLIGDTYTYFRKTINLKISNDGNISSFGPHIILDRRAGLYSYDKIGQLFPMIYLNISNLWIGAAEDLNYHHCGKTYISAGFDLDSISINPTAWQANDTIYIAIPYYNSEGPVPRIEGHPNDSYIYPILHAGNLILVLQDNPSLLSRLKTALGI